QLAQMLVRRYRIVFCVAIRLLDGVRHEDPAAFNRYGDEGAGPGGGLRFGGSALRIGGDKVLRAENQYVARSSRPLRSKGVGGEVARGGEAMSRHADMNEVETAAFPPEAKIAR